MSDSPDHFTLYNNAMTAMEQAAKRVTELVDDVHGRFRPLFENWKAVYLADVVDPIPAILLRGGTGSVPHPIRTADLPDIYRQIMIAMETYAQNLQDAMKHWNQIPQVQKERIVLPPWMRTMTEPRRRP
jgi:hypothetical protein